LVNTVFVSVNLICVSAFRNHRPSITAI